MSEWKDGLPGVGVECEFKSPGSHFAENFVWCKYHGTLVNGEGLIIEHLKTHPTLTCVDSYDPALTTFRPIKKREPKPGEVWLVEGVPCVTCNISQPMRLDGKFFATNDINKMEYAAPDVKSYIAREILKDLPDTSLPSSAYLNVLNRIEQAARLDEE